MHIVEDVVNALEEYAQGQQSELYIRLASGRTRVSAHRKLGP